MSAGVKQNSITREVTNVHNLYFKNFGLGSLFGAIMHSFAKIFKFRVPVEEKHWGKQAKMSLCLSRTTTEVYHEIRPVGKYLNTTLTS